MRNVSLFLFVIAFIAFIFSFGIYFFVTQPLETKTFFASVHISSDTGGFDVNKTALTFGSVVMGGNSLRRVFLENKYPFPVRVEPSFTGSIAPLIQVQTPIIVGPNQSVYIPVFLTTDSAEVLRDYNGNISFTLLRAR